MYLLPLDELNNFRYALPTHFENGVIRSKEDEDEVFEELIDLFILSFTRGQAAANQMLVSDVSASFDEANSVINREVAGKTWRERVTDYFANGGTEADIARIAETEANRITNEAAYKTAQAAGATTKTWNCMMLPTSRDTHRYLDGVTVPLNAEFYSYKGNSTQFPCEWGVAEEDVNCLCWLTYSK